MIHPRISLGSREIVTGHRQLTTSGLGHFPRTFPPENAKNVVEIEAGMIKQYFQVEAGLMKQFVAN